MRCGCEDGNDCTRSTICAIDSAVEDATASLQLVVDAAVEYMENIYAGHHGPNGKATKRSLFNLGAAVTIYKEDQL